MIKKCLTLFILIIFVSSCKTNKILQNKSIERSVYCFTDTSYIIEMSHMVYKKLIPSIGDTSFIYKNELMMIDGVKLFSIETKSWVNFKMVESYE